MSELLSLEPDVIRSQATDICFRENRGLRHAGSGFIVSSFAEPVAVPAARRLRMSLMAISMAQAVCA